MMKVVTYSMLAGALLVAVGAQAQDTGVRGGVLLGGMRSVLDGQINAKAFPKTGLTGGGVLRIRPSERFAFQPEILYVQEGTGNGLSPTSSSADYDFRLHYLALPLMAKVYIGRLVNVQAGPVPELLLSAWQVGNVQAPSGRIEAVNQDLTNRFSALSFALSGGLGIDLSNGLLAQVRVNYGLSDINDNSDEAAFRQRYSIGGLHNRSISFTLGYLFKG